MSDYEKPTVGRIVHFYPGKGSGSYQLPNGMDFAPAIVTQIFPGEPQHYNLVVFQMAREDQAKSMQNSALKEPHFNAWSIVHESEKTISEDESQVSPYWTWPPREDV